MQYDRLEIVRQTKLDLAQWIAAGMGRCRNPATSQMLARYASAQLQSAALIPQKNPPVANRPLRSLLREEIQRGTDGGNRDCLAVLSRVSRAMVHLLAGQSRADRAEAVRDITTAKLIRHELRAHEILFDSMRNKSAA